MITYKFSVREFVSSILIYYKNLTKDLWAEFDRTKKIKSMNGKFIIVFMTFFIFVLNGTEVTYQGKTYTTNPSLLNLNISPNSCYQVILNVTSFLNICFSSPLRILSNQSESVQSLKVHSACILERLAILLIAKLQIIILL